MSGQNSEWWWGPGNPHATTIVAVMPGPVDVTGFGAYLYLMQFFTSVRVAATLSNPYGLHNLSGKMLAAMRDNAARLGFEHLVAPVRPNRKHLVPDVPIEEYAALVREDGLPQDPWLRVHVRAGGRIVGTCKRAMVIPGTLDEWRSWTGLPFDESGPVVVPGALVPVQCSVEHDYAVYVEPAVWVHHRL